MKKRFSLLWVSISLMLFLGFQCQLSLADQRIGVSYPNYGEVEVLPNSIFSGTFTVFNQGSENITAYAEIRGSPGQTELEWAIPKPQGGAMEWITGTEMNITTGTYRYARFTVQLGELTQGQWYNWSIMVGYVDTNPLPHAVAANGISIRMIWPKPTPWYAKVPWGIVALLGIITSVALLVGKHVRQTYRDAKPYDPAKSLPSRPEKTMENN